MSGERLICAHCQRALKDMSALYSHTRAKHGRAAAKPFRSVEDESMADLFVRAEINRAMGVQNPDWVEEMLAKG